MRLRFAAMFALLAALPVPAALAAWSNSPTPNLAVCTATGNQSGTVAISDGNGGMYLMWSDTRNGGIADIYAQHVLATGVVDPAWPVNGAAVCTATNSQFNIVACSDGAGGAILAWWDPRGAATDLYAHHLIPTGVDPAWPVNGRLITGATNDQFNVRITSDDAGGAFLAWCDNRAGGNDLYVHHLLSTGVVDPAWPADGRALCTAASIQTPYGIVSDGAGGAIVSFADQRAGVSDIYVHHVVAGGAVDATWPADGRAVCTAAGAQDQPLCVPDGGGGALIAWSDNRTGSSDLYAHRVLKTGALDNSVPADGRAICLATGTQSVLAICPDGGGGAILAWMDERGAAGDIYALRVLAGAAPDPAWPTDGRAVCTATQLQTLPALAPDGTGGAYLVWTDARTGSNDLYGHHVLPTGVLESSFPADGRLLSAAAGSQTSAAIVSDGLGGFLAGWQDTRASATDIYAQRVARHGYLGSPEPELVSAKDVPLDQGGQVKLAWNASYLENDPYGVVTSYRMFRSVPPFLAARMREAGTRVVPAEETRASFDRPGELMSTTVFGQAYFWEYLATVNADFLPNYSWLAPTEQDSVDTTSPPTAFMVQARGGSNLRWESLPVLGRSVDNLAPAAPQPFTGEYAGGATTLHWNPNPEADLSHYRLYRGSTPGFVPGPGNLVASPPDTGHVDAAGAPYIYKLTAVDTHGNESPVATLIPAGTTAVGDAALAREVAFAAPSPNPASHAATLSFTLPRPARVELAIVDASGRLVRRLTAGRRAAGAQSERWNLRDANGGVVAAGLYFARLEVDGASYVRRLAVTR